MFSNPPRPVPSRAALRVLYQLAYISSGTAVGVAALCAEERRRRTGYVQKIADNAKRLRQSPRHVHNVATAVKGSEDSGVGDGFWEEQSREEDQGWMTRAGPGKRLVRAPELPSVVEKGYRQVTKDHKRVRRRGPSEARSGRQGDNENGTTPREPGSVTTRKPYRPLSEQRGGPKEHFTRQSERIPSSDDRFRIRPDDVIISIQPRPSFRLKEAAELVSRPRRGEVRETTRDADVIRHDVELFFRSVPWTSSESRIEARVAGRLLKEGLRQGCLAEVRQLMSWKLANDSLTEEDVAILPEAYLARDPESRGSMDVFELFAEVFESEAFGRLPEQLRLTEAISVATDSFSWDIELDLKARARRLLHSPLQNLEPGRVDLAARSLCDGYLASGQIRKAYSVVDSLRKAQTRASASALNGRWKAIYQSITEHAMKHGDLWSCVKLADTLVRAGDDPDRVPLITWILQECRKRKSFVPVRKLAVHLLHLDHWKILPDQAKVDLALALSAVYKKGVDDAPLRRLFSAIPEALRGPVTEAWCADRLHTVWKTQRNLPAVWAEYERAKTYQFERFGSAELALIEICNKAKQPNQALRLLSSSLRHDAHNATYLCVAAVSMARNSAWRQLRGLFDLIAKSGNFVNDISTSRNLNATIDIYSRRHTAAETWKFVTDMVATVGFTPTRTTTNIMLQCFVTKQTLELVPQWIRYLKTIGNDFRMNAQTATKLMSCFYFDQRPPHALLVWFSRNLVNKWPSFDADELKDLIRTSIGYDLRKLPAQDKASLRDRAEHNLTRMAAPNRGIPAPYRSSTKVQDQDVKSDADPLTSDKRAVDDGLNFTPLGKPASQKADDLNARKTQPIDVDQLLAESSGLTVPPAKAPARSTGKAPSMELDKDLEDFATLRPQYLPTGNSLSKDVPDLEEPGASRDGSEYVRETRRQKRIVKEMILELSQHHYNQVLNLYQASLSPIGLPISPLSLEVAMEASIRLQKGGISEASAMLDAAKGAGMEVRRAMGPLLVHRIHSFDPTEKKDANAIRTMVIDYYRSNEENGFPVKHHVGITAANTLINNQRAEYGINILNAIYHSEWALERPLDIVAMTVYLKGYAALNSEQGIQWVMRKVLMGNMDIDRPFISALKDVCKSFGIGSVVRRTRTKFDRTGFLGRLRTERQQCIVRRHQQRFQTKKFGNLLVKRILQCVDMERQPTVDMEKREELEEAFFGKPTERGDSFVGEEGSQKDAGTTAASGMESEERTADLDGESAARPTRLEARRAKTRLAKSIRFQGEERTATRRTLKQTGNSEWLKQYRAFTRKDLIMANGKLASFRRYVQ